MRDSHSENGEAMDSDIRYLSLLKEVISGKFSRENGLRIKYLIDCFDTSQPYDLRHVIDIGADCADAMAMIVADQNEQNHYKERIFGFPMSMLGQARLDNIEVLLRHVIADDIPGGFLEAGVWRGGACIFARALLDVLAPDQDRLVFVADSFAGLPQSDHAADQGFPLHLDPTLACSLDQVRRHFRQFNLDPDHNVRFVEGLFADSLPGLQTGGLAVLRADGDLFVSTRDILTNLYDQLSPGGFVIIDDYNALPPCRQATDQFRASRGITAPMQPIDWTGIYWRKPCL
jgi:hypothetical protein